MPKTSHIKLADQYECFHEAIQEAANAGKIPNTNILYRELNSDFRVFSGLEILIEIVRNNAISESEFDPENPQSIAPLGFYRTDALLSLASEVCKLRVGNLSNTASWLEDDIMRQEGKQ